MRLNCAARRWSFRSKASGVITAGATLWAAAVVPVAASMVVGEPIVLGERANVSVRFHSQSATAAGSLYFLGSEKGGVATLATSTDSSGLGIHLFDNHRATRGDQFNLGVFEAGSILNFAHLITDGVPVAPTGSLFRTDIPGDLAYFAQRKEQDEDTGLAVTRVGVEDIRDQRLSDFDFNDLKFDIVRTPAQTPTPTPGNLALFGVGAVMLASRRRRPRDA